MTVVAIHQPNYLPWLGYFHKINDSNVFVFLDDVNFSKGSWINRNRIKGKDGVIWLTVPVKRDNLMHTQIRDVMVDYSTDWYKKHWNVLVENYKTAEHFDEVAELFVDHYKQLSSEQVSLIDLNVSFIKLICEILDIKIKMVFSSELNVEGKGTERLINISKAIGKDLSFYLSGKGSSGYLDESLFENSGVGLIYQDQQYLEYRQLFGEFIPNLSIIDVLFNEGIWFVKDVMTDL